ncbi:MAG: ADP-ribosylglycohydrolase family protein [Gemmatimonadetes bacterium]|nr:ADP-ribosylglycohydrolase family protein [Gemmatimonadota bacterium]
MSQPQSTPAAAPATHSDAHLGRYRGALLGLATGDALGTTLEFTPPERVRPINEMVGGGPFDLEPGQWTDDTSMAMCLAESLVEHKGFDAKDQMQRYVLWWKEGYWSSRPGVCFDIGNTTSAALSRFRQTGNAFAGKTSDNAAGNGSLMRLAPVPLFFARDPEQAIRMAGESSRTTHGAPAAVDACRYFAALLLGALAGVSKEELLAECYSPVPELWSREPLHERVAEVAGGSFRRKSPPEIKGGHGFVIDTLEAALWAFATTNNFESGALAAVNLGGDADTTGAVYGQIAGAYYGVSGIPVRWVERLAFAAEIDALAAQLHEVAQGA